MRNFKRLGLLFAIITLLFSPLAPSANAADIYQWTASSSLGSTSTFKTAMSSDGSVILVGKQTDGVYLSTNSGSTFTKVSTIPNAAYGVAVSGNGMKMFAVTRDGNTVYYSVNQGVTWSTKTSAVGSQDNYASCMSGNGSVWMTGQYGGNMYLSTDNGATWSSITALGTQNWWACYISNDGTKRLALPFGGALRYSSNSGSNWTTSSTTVPDAYCLGSSDDASKIIIGSRVGNAVYRSTNSGNTFALNKSVLGNVQGCYSSADGTKLVAGVYGSYLLVSIDSGSTWNAETTPGSLNWYNFAMSTDGMKAIAGSLSSASTYLGELAQPSSLTLTSRGNSLIYRKISTVVVTSNVPGKITLFANSKRIAGCISMPTVSLSVSCDYRPSARGSVTVTAKFVPSNPSSGTISIELFRDGSNGRMTMR